MVDAVKSRSAVSANTARSAAKVMCEKQPTLYLDIIGTLLLQEGSNFRLAPFAREFVTTVRSRFRLVFLTSLTRPAAKEVADLLGVPIEFREFRKALGKSSGIDFAESFFWIDDAPSSRDLMRLAEERCSAQLITVNGKDGVTQSTLTKLEAGLAGEDASGDD